MPYDIIELPPLPDGTPSGISVKIRRKRKRPFYDFKSRTILPQAITPESINIVANEIVKGDLTPHQKMRNDYDGTGTTSINTLAKVIHHNHSTEIHESIMNNHTDISYANLYYGDKKVRIESNGNIMAIVLYCTNIPKNVGNPSGWKNNASGDKIVLYTEGDNLISGDITLFHYNTPLRVYRAEVIGAEEVTHYPYINIEGVDYWEYLKGNWETMDAVHWQNYKAGF